MEKLKNGGSSEKKCDKCGAKTSSLKAFYAHRYKCRKIPGNKVLSCGSCNRKFSSYFLRTLHKKTCVESNLNKKCLLKKKLLKKKSLTKIEREKLHCPNCPQVFDSHIKLSSHVKVCKPKKSVKDNFSARKSIKSEKSPTCNIASMDPKEDKKAVCLWCKNIYPSDEILSKHILKNESCAKAYQRKNDLKIQSQKVQGNARKSMGSVPKPDSSIRKPETSIRARKSFPHPHRLSPHTHRSKASRQVEGSARKSFPNSPGKMFHKSKVFSPVNSSGSVCPVCNGKFNDPILFYKHQKKYSHWGKATKSISNTCRCPFCSKDFSSIYARNAHLQNHKNVSEKQIESFMRKITCSACLRAFATESAKNQHIMLVHPMASKVCFGSRKKSTKDKKESLPLAVKQKLEKFPKRIWVLCMTKSKKL